MRVRALAAAAAAAIAVVPFGAVAAQADTEELTLVSVIHGVPLADFETVDVYANGELFLDDFSYNGGDPAPGDPEFVDLPAGDYEIGLAPADSSDAGDVILSETFTVEGPAVSIVAHLDADGAVALTAFVDDVTQPEDGKARVSVRHAAAAPAVDVLAGDTPLITGLENGEKEDVTVDAGTYPVSVIVSGSDIAVPGLDLGDVTLPSGSAFELYAIGPIDEEEPVEESDDATEETTEDSEDASALTESDDIQLPTYDYIIIEVFAGEDDGGKDDDDDETPTATPPIPTAVPAGDGTSSWAGPLALPALVALTLAGVLALAVGLAVRKSGSRA
jgi:hypothetical protein